MADDTIDGIFRSLMVIGSVSENERISTERGVLTIEPTNNMQFLWRWWYRESRMANMAFIRKVITDSFAIADTALEKEEAYYNTRHNTSRRAIEEQLANRQLLERLREELQKAIKGLHNFGVTYKHDMSMVSHVQLLLTKVTNKLIRIEKSMDYINENKEEDTVGNNNMADASATFVSDSVKEVKKKHKR